MDNNKKMMLSLALVAIVAISAIGVGYAYTAMTSNTGNNVELAYLTMIPYDTDRDPTNPTPTSYVAAFDGTHIKYDSETKLATEAGTSSGGGTIAIDDEIIVYTIADDTYNVHLTESPSGSNAMKIGQLYLQIDERKATAGDTYKISMVAGNENKEVYEADPTKGLLDTTDFAFKVGFQVAHPTGDNKIVAPIYSTDTLDALFKQSGEIPLPSDASLVDYTANTGAESVAINVNPEGFTIVLVTLWLTSGSSVDPQTFLSSEIYPASGDAKAPVQPMIDCKFTFKADTEAA